MITTAVVIICISIITTIFAANAGEYTKDVKQTAGSKQGAMSRFVHKAAAASSCLPSRNEAARAPQSTYVQSDSKLLGHSQDLSEGPQGMPNKRTLRDFFPNMQQQPDPAASNPFKLPRKGIGPMDRFLK